MTTAAVQEQVGTESRQPGRPAHPAPLFILAPPRSFTSVIGAMIGQHPQMYGIAEAQLTACETIADWWRRSTGAETWAHRPDGLVRIVAELFFGSQTEKCVRRALAWLRRRFHLGSDEMMAMIVERVAPLILVDKSPTASWSVEAMKRAWSMFPQARFIHLLRHPRGQCESVLQHVEKRRRKSRPLPPEHWRIMLCSFRPPHEVASPAAPPTGQLDPQWGWYHLNRNILDFLAEVPAERAYRLRGEDVLTNPDSTLRPLCRWLDLRDDDQAIEEMKHPERSPFACIGPPSARYGMDGLFLKNPVLRPSRAEPKSLAGPLSWRTDGSEFAPDVRRLALELGYT